MTTSLKTETFNVLKSATFTVGTPVTFEGRAGIVKRLCGPKFCEIQLEGGDLMAPVGELLPRDAATKSATSVRGTSERAGRYMRTSSGRRYYPMDPRADEIEIEVIAHHLSMKCRYAGATQRFYSVAEHSVYVALDLILLGYEINVALAGLLHDGSEAYNGDLIRPLKYDAEFAAPFKKVEEMNEKVIAERFEIAWPWHPAVKKSDEAVTSAELRQIMKRVDDPSTWAQDKMHDDSRVAPFEIRCLMPGSAKNAFLALFEALEAKEHPKTVGQIHYFLTQYA